MKILQVNCHDFYGGAETIMQAMHDGFRALGHKSQILVGQHHNKNFECFVFNHNSKRDPWARFWINCSETLLKKYWRLVKGRENARKIGRFLTHNVGQPWRTFRKRLGHEDFEFPDTEEAIRRIMPRPNLIHFHGLHGIYFDMRALRKLGPDYPLSITLHDTWFFTGHCAYSGSCNRFEIGCGSCPDLVRYPKVARDATAYNMQRKLHIYERARMSVATPSKWLMEMFDRSQASQFCRSKRVIYNGIDVNRFRPRDKFEARRRLNLNVDEIILIFVARNAKTSPYKDYTTVEKAVVRFAKHKPDKKIRLSVLGDEGKSRKFDNLTIEFQIIPTYEEALPLWYAACDALVHGAKAENLPTVILEAQACARPVVGTRTGGIPEEIVDVYGKGAVGKDHTGFVVDQSNHEQMASALLELFKNDHYCDTLGSSARAWAVQNFDQSKMSQNYLEWYDEILDDFAREKRDQILSTELSGRKRRVYVDVSHAVRSEISTGIVRTERSVYRELKNHVDAKPLVYERALDDYCHPLPTESKFLDEKFCAKQKAKENPESATSSKLIQQRIRILTRDWRKIHKGKDFRASDVILFPEVFHDSRVNWVENNQGFSKKIAIFHDAVPLEYPELSTFDQINNFEKYIKALSMMDLVVCVSKASKISLLRAWEIRGITPASTSVMTWPLSLQGRRPSNRYQPDHKTIVYVASLEPRKNHLQLLYVCKDLWNQDYDFELILVGKKSVPDDHEILKVIRAFKKEGCKIIWHKHVGDNQLTQIYQEAYVTVYPSLAEGYGLPIVESLWFGVPCICSDVGNAKEITKGGGTVLVAAGDNVALGMELKRVLKNEEWTNQLRKQARSRLFKRWHHYAGEILQSIDEVEKSESNKESRLRAQTNVHLFSGSEYICDYSWLEMGRYRVNPDQVIIHEWRNQLGLAKLLNDVKWEKAVISPTYVISPTCYRILKESGINVQSQLPFAEMDQWWQMWWGKNKYTGLRRFILVVVAKVNGLVLPPHNLKELSRIEETCETVIRRHVSKKLSISLSLFVQLEKWRRYFIRLWLEKTQKKMILDLPKEAARQSALNHKVGNDVFIVQLADIGDLVMTRPLIKEIKESMCNEGRLVVAVSAHTAELARSWDEIDVVVEFSYRSLAGAEWNKLRIGHPLWWEEGRNLIANTFTDASPQIAISARFDQDAISVASQILVVCSKAPKRFGYPLRDIMGNLTSNDLLTHRIKEPNGIHEIERIIAIGEKAYGDVFSKFKEIHFQPSGEKIKSEIYEIGLGIGAGNELKIWPIVKFRELCKAIAENYQIRISIYGGQSDIDDALWLKQSLELDGVKSVNYCGRLSLSESYRKISQLDLFVGNDSGPMHMAAINNIATVGIFGPVNPDRYGPFSNNSSVVRSNLPCAPCHCECWFDKNYCMEQISVREVIGACESHLAKATKLANK